MLILLYRLVFPLLLLIAAPYYGYRMRKRGGYGTDFSHRFGNFPDLPAPAPGVNRIWIQAVSVGEVLALEPLLKQLHNDKQIEIILTTTTSTGYAEARKRYGDKCRFTGCFPIDWWPFSSQDPPPHTTRPNKSRSTSFKCETSSGFAGKHTK